MFCRSFLVGRADDTVGRTPVQVIGEQLDRPVMAGEAPIRCAPPIQA